MTGSKCLYLFFQACLTPSLAAMTPVSKAPTGHSANVVWQRAPVTPVTKVIILTQEV